MLFFPSETAIAVESQNPHPPATSKEIPIDWLLGSGFALIMVFFGIIWWVKGMAGKVEATEKSLVDLEAKLSRERREDKELRKELKDELRHGFKLDLIQSENAISHSLELFMVEVRAEFKKISEGLDARNATVNRLGKKVDHLSNEMMGIASQLQQQNIPVHYRRGDDSSSGFFDD